MADLMMKDDLLIALLMCSSFGAPSIYSHDGLIGPFDPLVDDGNVNRMVSSRYVDNVACYFCQIVLCYFLRDFLSFDLVGFDSFFCFF